MAVVGLETTLYRVSEGEGVEVCATVNEPNGNINCPITFPFEVNISTRDGSAGIIITVQIEHFTLSQFYISQYLQWTMIPCPWY